MPGVANAWYASREYADQDKRMVDDSACTLSHRVPWRPAARHGSSRLTRLRCTPLRVLPSSLCKGSVYSFTVHVAACAAEFISQTLALGRETLLPAKSLWSTWRPEHAFWCWRP